MRHFFLQSFVLVLIISSVFSRDLKPYTLGAQNSENLEFVKRQTRISLQSAGFTVLGAYQPALDETRWVFIINSPEMIEAVQQFGELTGFAAAMRVALTLEGGRVNISYTNPIYLGNAYFQKNYADVAPYFLEVEQKIKSVMKTLGTVVDKPFGVKEGLKAKAVGHYHYMFGMEYFEDVVKLNEFSSYSVGKSIIESKLSKGGNTKLVYAYEIPGKELKLYGIALSGSTGEEHFLPIIDISEPKHTAFLPYEVLLMGNTAIMLHGRYRIALAFPDLSMTTFGKIMSTPGDIENLLRSVTE